MKAQQELPQASNQQTLVPTSTEGSPFPRQLDRRKKPIEEHMVSIITVNMTAIFSYQTQHWSSAVSTEQLSARAHADTKQRMGRVKQWCVVWCVTVARWKTNKVYFSVTKTASSCVFSVFTFLPNRNRKDQRYRAQAGKRISVNGTILRHWAPTACKRECGCRQLSFTPVIQVARVRLQSTPSFFPAVSQVAIPAIYSMTPAAWALQPEPSGKELPGEPARTGRINQKYCRGRIYQPSDKLSCRIQSTAPHLPHLTPCFKSSLLQF